MRFFKWFSKVLEDSSGSQSSKRLVSIGAFTLLGVAFLLNLWLDFLVEEYMWDGMITLVIFGLGFSASEKFSGIIKSKKDREEET